MSGLSSISRFKKLFQGKGDIDLDKLMPVLKSLSAKIFDEPKIKLNVTAENIDIRGTDRYLTGH